MTFQLFVVKSARYGRRKQRRECGSRAGVLPVPGGGNLFTWKALHVYILPHIIGEYRFHPRFACPYNVRIHNIVYGSCRNNSCREICSSARISVFSSQPWRPFCSFKVNYNSQSIDSERDQEVLYGFNRKVMLMLCKIVETSASCTGFPAARIGCKENYKPSGLHD